jgi:hypothetical protein
VGKEAPARGGIFLDPLWAKVKQWGVERAVVTVAGITIVLLLIFYVLFGLLGAGPVQKGEVPLWLRSVQAASGIFQATATGLAFIVGGLFAYYRFFKEETYTSRLQPSVSTAVSYSENHFCAVVTATVENTGQITVERDNSVTQFLVSVRGLGEANWTPYAVGPVLQQDMVQPGETLSDQSWVEVPNNGEAALQTELVVGRVSEGDEEEVSGWGAKDIVNLLDIRGSISDTSDGDVERG